MTKHDGEKLCFQCMCALETPGSICPRCHYDNTRRRNETGFLQECVLKEQYLVGRALGRGGFGVTYAGYDLNLRRRVAIKEYFPIMLTTRDSVTTRVVPFGDSREQFGHGMQRALDEGRLVVSMGNLPNVVNVYNAFQENGTVYIVMEYIDGVTLAQVVRSRGKLGWKHALELLRPIMSALEAIHAKGVIHRDVSPENIMLNEDTNETVLLDFGAARSYLDANGGMTQNLRPGFTPIEQYSASEKQDERVDEYSLCATFYYLITGVYPDSADKRAYLEEHLSTPRELGAEIPEKVENVLLKGMAIKAEDRYHSIPELRRALANASGEGAQGTSTPTPHRKNKSGAALAVVALIAALAVALVLAGKNGWIDLPFFPTPSPVPTTPEPTTEPTPEPTSGPLIVLYQDDINVRTAIYRLHSLGYLDSMDHENFDVDCWYAYLQFCQQNGIDPTDGVSEEGFELLSRGNPVPAPTATPSPSPTPTPTPTSSPSPTPTSTPTSSPSPTPTSTPTAVPVGWRTMRSDHPEEVTWKNKDEDWPVLGSEYLRSNIYSVRFADTLEGKPHDAWDVSENGDGSVWAWVISVEGKLNLIIAADGCVKLNADASYLFNRYTQLKSIDFSGVDTSSVSNMENMFRYCESLTKLDLSCLDTSNVTTMSRMFSDCRALTKLDLSCLDTSNVTNMSRMIYDCRALTELDLSNLNTVNVTNMSGLFSFCTNLESLDISSFNTANVTDMSSMFYYCKKLTDLDLSTFDTSAVNDMSQMFGECSSLTALDLSSFNTSAVNDMSKMFYFDSMTSKPIMTSLDLSMFDTSNVTNMSWMFYCFSSLTELDVSSFDTSNVTNMDSMFAWCESLKSLNLSSFNTSSVTDMSWMFAYCESLTKLNLSSFSTNNVTNMQHMFAYCESLTSLDLTSFDTSNVTDMQQMFYYCSSLAELDLSSFDTSQVTDMRWMFFNCKSLTELDLSSFDTSKVTDMSGMFFFCENLSKVIVSKKFIMDSVTAYEDMFSHCKLQSVKDFIVKR